MYHLSLKLHTGFINIQMYGDDTQLHLTFVPSEWHSARCKMEACIAELRKWLLENHLKLNDNKTEIMILGQPSLGCKIEGDSEIHIGGCTIKH